MIEKNKSKKKKGKIFKKILPEIIPDMNDIVFDPAEQASSSQEDISDYLDYQEDDDLGVFQDNDIAETIDYLEEAERRRIKINNLKKDIRNIILKEERNQKNSNKKNKKYFLCKTKNNFYKNKLTKPDISKIKHLEQNIDTIQANNKKIEEKERIKKPQEDIIKNLEKDIHNIILKEEKNKKYFLGITNNNFYKNKLTAPDIKKTKHLEQNIDTIQANNKKIDQLNKNNMPDVYFKPPFKFLKKVYNKINVKQNNADKQKKTLLFPTITTSNRLNGIKKPFMFWIKNKKNKGINSGIPTNAILNLIRSKGKMQ